ncbi:ABC transporter ATP-binding protein [Microlunatus speluncae]|uniref:ABC transporter ATP-binding protein n=1 Tax=Microlunatus speluncae TaxID=2594267 RepID=UPI0012660B63|nr:ABC transporter ATP-binding protein [Microlunatus speluncae]
MITAATGPDPAVLSWSSVRRLFDVVADGRRAQLAGLGLLVLLGAVLPLIGPQLVRLFIDQAVAGSPLSWLAWIAVGFLVASLLHRVVGIFVGYATTQVAWAATNALRERVARHVLDLDLAFHDDHSPGELIERTDGDASALSSFLSSFLRYVVGSLFTLLGVLSLVLIEDWRIGLALVVYVLIAAAVIMSLRNFAIPSAIERRAASAELFGVVEEELHGAEDLRANAGGSYALHRFRTTLARFIRAGLRSSGTSRTTWVITGAVFAAGTVLSLAGGVWLYQAGSITLGAVYVLFRYTSLLRDPLDAIAEQQQLAQEAIAGFSRIQQLLALEPSIRDTGRSAGPAGAGAPSVRLDHVGFAYPGGAPILRDIDLAVEPGEVLGLVGQTGSGKTTLARLLLRLLDPSRGTVRLGGVDLREIPLAELRGRIALVTQHVQLFHTTVRDNLTLFGTCPAADDAVIDVLSDLGLEPWLRSLPAGLDTELGPGGTGVSAGEAQLIAFARVFLRNPGLVILDEATSRLDPVTERQVERAVDSLLTGRTAVIIAHRLDTLDRADRIAVLDAGRLVEHGDRQALGADPTSRFAHLLRAARAGALR